MPKIGMLDHDRAGTGRGQQHVCGGELVTREDDTDEALATRLREYHEKTDPVLEIFRRKECVITVDARLEAVAVEFDLVDPQRPGGWLLGK